MTLQSFIYSNKPAPRLLRHLAFWAMYYIYAIIGTLPNTSLKTLSSASFYTQAWQEATAYLPVLLFGVYVAIYFILPRYLAKRNAAFLFMAAVSLTALSLVVSYFIAARICAIHGTSCTRLDLFSTALFKSNSVLFVISGSAVVIKIMKDYALRQKENERLALHNIRNGLRLLKMQMHPSILFASLEAIYNDIERGALYAPEMILKVSDLLSYLLYETGSNEVAVSKEVAMLENYVALKGLEYKNELRSSLEISGDMNGLVITPGLLLPLLETGFMPLEAWTGMHDIAIELKADTSKVYFTLKNNTPGDQLIKRPAARAALNRLKETLQLFYPGRFKLETHPAAGSFALKLQLRLKTGLVAHDHAIQNRESHRHAHS